jgi:hypothetical protein
MLRIFQTKNLHKLVFPKSYFLAFVLRKNLLQHSCSRLYSTSTSYREVLLCIALAYHEYTVVAKLIGYKLVAIRK